mmetsp:Transcript_9417/g.14201  ORF Transcript_9417/g.14201 Transcript_9417/m.14201 type:complete len:337 (+) Transcript_9417:933-1943(+)
MSCAFVDGGKIASVSLRGDISILDPNSESCMPSKVICAHQVAITAMCLRPVEGKLITGSFDGVVVAWNESGEAARFKGQLGSKTLCGASHSNKVSGIAYSTAGIVSVGWDDFLRLADKDTLEYVDSVSLSGQPCGVSANPSSEFVAVATSSTVALYKKTVLIDELEASYVPKSIALKNEEEVAIGAESGTVYVYPISGGKLGEPKEVKGHRGAVTALSYSFDGKYVAVGDAAREVTVWETSEGPWTAKVQGLWQFHTSKVMCVSWSPDSKLIASGGTDESVYIWSVDFPRKRIFYKFANKFGVDGLCWLSDKRLASSGGDHAVAVWDVEKDMEAFS